MATATERPQLEALRAALRAVRSLTNGKPAFDRLLRLYACAAARVVWIYVPEGPCRDAVEVAERCADRQVTADALERAKAAAMGRAVVVSRGKPSGAWAATNTAAADAFTAAQQTTEEVLQLFAPDVQARNARALGQLLDDLFAPYLADTATSPDDPPECVLTVRRFAADARVRSAADDVYAARDFYDMRTFGELLRAAGCRDADIVSHCCGGRHARGCWVIDAARQA